jgi:hypothetical protein
MGASPGGEIAVPIDGRRVAVGGYVVVYLMRAQTPPVDPILRCDSYVVHSSPTGNAMCFPVAGCRNVS